MPCAMLEDARPKVCKRPCLSLRNPAAWTVYFCTDALLTFKHDDKFRGLSPLMQ
jgi:hypothetical protein